MKKTEIKRLKVGDKYIKTNNYGKKSIRTIKFICYLNNKPFFIFYGTGLGQRNCYEDLLRDSYQIYKINKKVLGSTQEESATSLWHDASEKAEKGKLYLYRTNQNVVDINRSEGKEFPDYCDKWAYIDDLLKL